MSDDAQKYNNEFEDIKNKICELIILEKDIISRRYTLYIEEVKRIENDLDLTIWINNYSYIFTIYGQKDLEKIYKLYCISKKNKV